MGFSPPYPTGEEEGGIGLAELGLAGTGLFVNVTIFVSYTLLVLVLGSFAQSDPLHAGFWETIAGVVGVVLAA
jgi:hypothetical protein